ncbi:MAG: molybdopterin molybdotransferase MoeA [Acidobacteriaceae bacterium]|nr:molybdopterin molybdotransferase MoeA [Acidobacteriaceae bacterium]
MAEQVLAFDEALSTVLAHAAKLGPPATSRSTSLAACRNTVLAEELHAQRDQPPFHRSTRDGYALRSASLGQPLKLLGTVRAGELWRGRPLQPGEAIEIMTGAPLPAGCDCVLMVEHATLLDGFVNAAPGRTLQPGENVVPQGSEALAGQLLLRPGLRIDAATIALAASCGRSTLQTYAPPVVAIISTGDELVELDPDTDLNPVPEPEQIFNSNTHALTALVHAAGAQPLPLPIARDTLDDLRDRLAAAREADLILFTGGVSMGKYDLVEQALAEAGATFHFTGARIQPGKPVVFGHLGNRQPFFGLPGNPVSTEVCFHLFVAPLLRALAGQREALAPNFVLATAAEAFPGKPNLLRFLPAHLSATRVTPVAWQGSGDVAANARANCFAVVPPEGLAADAPVRILLRA